MRMAGLRGASACFLFLFFFLRKKGNNGFPGSLVRGCHSDMPEVGETSSLCREQGMKPPRVPWKRHWKRDLGLSKYLTNFFINQKML